MSPKLRLIKPVVQQKVVYKNRNFENHHAEILQLILSKTVLLPLSLQRGGGGGGSQSPKGFSSITFEENKLETQNFA